MADEREPEVIKDDMQDTRTALSEKVEKLEQQVVKIVEDTTKPVMETVQSVKDAVQGTVDAVKDSVQSTMQTFSGAAQSTVQTVKDTFDVPGHIQRHPWLAMAGSVAAGYVLGRLLPSAPPMRWPSGWSGDQMGSQMASAQGAYSGSYAGAERGGNGARAAAAEPPRQEQSSGGESWLGGLLDAYGGEIDKLKSLGIGAVVGVIRDMVSQNVQGEIGSRLTDWMNGLTETMGGKPFKEPLITPEPEQPAGQQTPYESATGRPGRGGSLQREPSGMGAMSNR